MASERGTPWPGGSVVSAIVRRLLSFLATWTAVCLFACFPALAAGMPEFEWAIEGHSDSVEVTVTFEPVPSGFAWASLEASGLLDQLVGVVQSEEVDPDGRPVPGADAMTFDLQRIETGVYGATIDTGPGEWAVVAWPLETESQSFPGVPETEFIAVGSNPRSSAMPWILAVGVGIVAVWWLSRSRRAVDV